MKKILIIVTLVCSNLYATSPIPYTYIGGGGDVVGPASAVDGRIPIFQGTTGKIIEDSGISSSNLVQKTVNFSAAYRVPLALNGTSKVLTETAYIFPVNDGAAGQVLSTDGLGIVRFRTAPTTFGDVVGPAGATTGRVVTFNGPTGKIVQDSGILSSNLVTMAAVGGAGNLLQTTVADRAAADSGVVASNVVTMSSAASVANKVLATTGANKIAQDSGVLSTELVTKTSNFGGAGRVAVANGATKVLNETAYTLTTIDGTANQVLSTNGTGAVTFRNAPATFGDTTGPASNTADNNVVVYNGTTGKIIKDSTVLISNIPTMSSVGGVGMLVQTAAADRAQSSSGIAVANVPTQAGNAGAANEVIVSGGANKTQATSSVLIGNIPTMAANGVAGNLLQTAAASKAVSDSGVAVANVVQKTANFGAANRVAVALNNSSRTLTETLYTLPLADGTVSGQYLATNAAGVVSWTTPAAGGVTSVFTRTGAVTATAGDYTATLVTNTAAGNIAGTTVQTALNELDTEKLALAGGTMTGALTLSGVTTFNNGAASSTFPIDRGTNTFVLKTNGSGALSWSADADSGGDVDGPASNTADNNVAVYNGTTGKIIKDSTVLISNIPTMAANGVAGNLLQTAAASKAQSDSGIAVANVIQKVANFTAANRVALASGVNKTLTETAYTIPATDGTANYVLKTNGAGVVSWAVDSAGTGDVTGPGSNSADNNVAVYNGTTGKIIKDSTVLISNLPTMAANGVAGNLLQTAAASKAVSDSGIALANVVQKSSNFTAANRVPLALNSTSRVLSETAYTIPTADGTVTQVLTTDGAGAATWSNGAGAWVAGAGQPGGTCSGQLLASGTMCGVELSLSRAGPANVGDGTTCTLPVNCSSKQPLYFYGGNTSSNMVLWLINGRTVTCVTGCAALNTYGTTVFPL